MPVMAQSISGPRAPVAMLGAELLRMETSARTPPSLDSRNADGWWLAWVWCWKPRSKLHERLSLRRAAPLQ